MTEQETFLQRWSRRKREAPDEPAPARDVAGPEQAGAPVPMAEAGESLKATVDEPVDLAALPSIESIVGDTDVRGFLQQGVPPELTRAALRRAWSSDPAIRDFVGLVENGWDFTAPDGVPGFASITGEEVARLLGQAVGAAISEPSEAPQSANSGDREAEPGVPTPLPEPEPASAEAESVVQRSGDIASQQT